MPGDTLDDRRCGLTADECLCGRTFRCQWCLHRVSADVGCDGLDGDADHCCDDCVVDHYDEDDR